MVEAVPDILARIVARKREELARAQVSRDEWESLAARTAAGRRDFRAAICRGPAVIAEIKKASPSKGVLAEAFDPVLIAQAYERGGAAALSVLTDEEFFQGRLTDLWAARGATRLPALRKDFTLEEYQVAEAAAHGADAVLLIAAILTTRELRRLREYAAGFGLAALVEVHDAGELDRAVDSGAGIIGVNNRDLRTFAVSIETSLRLAGRMPDGVIRVSESGIESPDHIRRLRDAGYQAFLIGERLMRSADPASALRALLS